MVKQKIGQLMTILIVVIPFLIRAESLPNSINTNSLVIGNFALPTSQQPGPFVSFGENIIDKGQIQLYLFGNAFIGNKNYSTDIIPSILYGIRDDLSFFFNIPLSPGNKDGKDHSSGIEDIFGQLEYAFYERNQPYSQIQATIVGNITLPTGSKSKKPPTGFGAPSFFIGSTLNYMTDTWLVFVSPGFVLTTTKSSTKCGNQFLYQCGLGRNIPSPQGWIFNWMVEFDGLYNWKNNTNGISDPNSGGNTAYLTPSVWISSKKIILQLGIGYPVIQHLFGSQAKTNLSFDANLGITF